MKRTYVQDLIAEDAARVWELVGEQGAWVYISGYVLLRILRVRYHRIDMNVTQSVQQDASWRESGHSGCSEDTRQ